MDASSVAAWIERYKRAWETNDPDTIGDLFAENTLYYMRPDEEPHRGRTNIVADWLERKDEPSNWTFRYEVLATAGNLAFVCGLTNYVDPATNFSNLWVIAFDDAGSSESFTEWWMEWR